jgi:hypothetical protein
MKAIPFSVAEGMVHLPAPVSAERGGGSDAPVQQVFHRRAVRSVQVFRNNGQIVGCSEHPAGLMQLVLQGAGGRMLCPAFEASLAGRIPTVRKDNPVRGGKKLFVLVFTEIMDNRFHGSAFLSVLLQWFRSTAD